ncbi:MAG: hypothetical protein GY696_29655, partial [Gammaproteobacteria bacterium]|nr:hypothetical protein [Gammaproteobacteria bacterium]
RYWWGGFGTVLIICMFIFVLTTDPTTFKNFALSMPFPVFVGLIAFADGLLLVKPIATDDDSANLQTDIDSYPCGVPKAGTVPQSK